MNGVKILAAVVLMVALVQGYCTAGRVQELLRLADQGDTAAMIDLATAYYSGRGVLKDPFKARCWIERALELGKKRQDEQTVLRAERLWNRLALWQYPGQCHLEVPAGSGPAPGERFVETGTGIAFVWVPGGCFSSAMGRKAGPKTDGRICPKGFWMGETEVTQAQWLRIMPDNPSRFRGEDLPVEQVSYAAVQEYIQKLNRATGLEFYLPTQVQWAFACTGPGGRRMFPWGDEAVRPRANCSGCDNDGSRGRSMPVASFPPNRAGLYDMGGNVREWCRDPRPSEARDRPVCGGSFIDPANRSGCRSGDRMLTGIRAYYLGFRLSAEQVR